MLDLVAKRLLMETFSRLDKKALTFPFDPLRIESSSLKRLPQWEHSSRASMMIVVDGQDVTH